MFSQIVPGDQVLVRKEGKGTSRYPDSFLVPVMVLKVTAKQFTVEGGNKYKKSDGGSIPRGGECLPYAQERDESDEFEKYNEISQVVSDVNSLFYDFGKSRVGRGTKNLHTILKQAEILSALIKEGSK